MIEFAALIIAALVVAVLGIRIGMLVAPRIDRWGAPPDPGDEEEKPA